MVRRTYTRDPAVCGKEIAILQSAAGRLPVPEIVSANPTGSNGGAPYILYRFIEGVTFQQLKTKGNRADMAQAAYAIGHALARIRTLPPPREAAPRRSENLNSPLLEDRIGRQYDRLRNYLSDWEPRFAELYDSGSLVHGDFNNRNTLVNRIGTRWVVSGILDWECAFAGSPLWDAARFICYERSTKPYREPYFSNGFRDGGGSLPADWSQFARAINTLTVAESLCRPDIPPHYVPELCELIAGI